MFKSVLLELLKYRLNTAHFMEDGIDVQNQQCHLKQFQVFAEHRWTEIFSHTASTVFFIVCFWGLMCVIKIC